MKKLLVGFLVLNFLFEGLVAVLLIRGSQSALAEVTADGVLWAMHYGFAAIAIASAVFWIWPARDNRHAVAAVLGVLLVFHAMLFVSTAMQGNQLPYAVIHGAMALFAGILYSTRSRYTS